jgi:hypothetical protein
MWKVVVSVLVVGFLAYKFIGGGGIHPGAAKPAGANAYEGYIEVRMLLKGPQREIEMVAIEERPPLADCDSDVSARIAKLCPAKVNCEIKSRECTTSVEPRYLKMLDQKPASVHYAHMQIDPDSASPRRAIVLGWGMTEQESLAVCGSIKASANKNIKNGVITCI